MRRVRINGEQDPAAALPYPAARVAASRPFRARWNEQESGEHRVSHELTASHPKQSRKIPALTGIRGVAAVWVVAFHFYPTLASLLSLPPRSRVPVMRDGFLAVDLFFLLSGFVLSLSYAERFQRNFSANLRSFALARAGRILPLHWAMLGVLVVLVTYFPDHWWGPGPFTSGSLIAAAALVQNWTYSTALSWNHPAWSLSAEWFAYILFPLLACCMKRFPGFRTAVVAAILSLTALDALILARHSLTLDHVGPMGIVRCLCEFTAGASLWKALGVERLRTGGNVWACIGAALLVVALAIPMLQLAAPFAFASLIVACALGSRLTHWLFGNPVGVFLGEVSFSIYLTHAILLGTMTLIGGRLDVANAPLALRIGFAVLFGTALVPVSYTTWRCVERPGQRLLRTH